MTQEEKAKAYDEAIKVAVAAHKDEDRHLKATLERIFPELKESEDERMVKFIKKQLFNIKKTITENYELDAKLTKAIDWLEKQGEQKPAEKVEPIEWSGKINSRNVKGVLKEMLDKKLKSADKVEPKFKVKYAGSEYNVLEVKDIAGVTFYGIEDEPNHIDYVKDENCERVGGYGIKESGLSFPTKPAIFSEQKPAWSEEELDSITAAINNLEYLKNNYVYHQMGLDPAITFLKSLKDRVQPKQEWSEEDEEELQIALDTLVKAGQHSSAKWLKNVCLVPQPQWKPSDEQMEALWNAVVYVESCNSNFKGSGSVLENLYNDLKKLKA